MRLCLDHLSDVPASNLVVRPNKLLSENRPVDIFLSRNFLIEIVPNECFVQIKSHFSGSNSFDFPKVERYLFVISSVLQANSQRVDFVCHARGFSYSGRYFIHRLCKENEIMSDNAYLRWRENRCTPHLHLVTFFLFDCFEHMAVDNRWNIDRSTNIRRINARLTEINQQYARKLSSIDFLSAVLPSTFVIFRIDLDDCRL